MKLVQLNEMFTPEKRYILNKHQSQFDDLVEFGGNTPGEEWFEEFADFRAKYPKAQKSMLFYSNPEKDYRALQSSMADYKLHTDFSIWMSGTGTLFFQDDLNDGSLTTIPEAVVQQMYTISIEFKTDAELLELMKKDNEDHPVSPLQGYQGPKD